MTVPALTCRLAGLEDAALIAALHEDCFPDEPWSATWISKLMTNPATQALLLDIDGTPAGLVLVSGVADEAEILTVGVLPAQRCQGGGRALVEAAAAALAVTGARRLFLEVSVDNTAAIGLYQACGFERTGNRPKYYADGSDAILMGRDIA